MKTARHYNLYMLEEPILGLSCSLRCVKDYVFGFSAVEDPWVDHWAMGFRFVFAPPYQREQ